jgi:DNA-binding HxlR family transcriptional regulator
MRSYGQACALAKALDLVGDRWTLLIARELLIRGTCRYTDLQHGLPGIPTNLLAKRLNELTEAGLLSRETAPPPVATIVYRLTERGKQLEPAIDALGKWGAPLLAGASHRDVFRSHWMALPVRLHVRDKTPSARPVRLEVRSGEEPIGIETIGDGSVATRLGAVDSPDATLDGPPHVVLGVLTGKLDLTSARKQGLTYRGNPATLRRFGGKQP